MAIELPRYQRQVGTSAESGAVRGSGGDVGSAGLEWRGVAEMGKSIGMATEVAASIMQKEQMVDYQADKANYQQFEAYASGRVQEAVDNHLLNGGSWQDIENVGQKELGAIDGEWKERATKYGEKAQEELAINYATFRQAQTIQLGATMRKKKLGAQQHDLEQAYFGMSKDNPEREATLNAIEAIGGPNARTNAQKQGQTFDLRAEVAGYEQEYILTGDTKKYINNLRGIDYSEIHPSVRKQFSAEAEAKVTGVMKTENKLFRAALVDFQKNNIDGVVDSTQYAQLEKLTNENFADAMQLANDMGTITKPVSDKEANDAVEDLEKIINGKTNLGNVVENNKEKGGFVGAITILTAFDLAVNQGTGKDAEVKAFDSWKMGDSIELNADPVTVDFLKSLKELMRINPGKMGEVYANNVKQFSQWRLGEGQGKSTQSDEWKAYREEMLKQPAMDYVSTLPARQQAGKRVVRSGVKDGRKVVQYEDGSIEYAD